MLGIIGGSGLYKLEGLEEVRVLQIDTPFGKPSGPIVVGKLEGKEVCFLPRHGPDHNIPPHLVPYKANLWALRELGVKRVLSVCAVGGINRNFRPGDVILINDFIDLTKGRESTYYNGVYSPKVEGEDLPAKLMREGKVVHVDMSQAYCPQMREFLAEVLKKHGVPFHPSGVYACTEGPRFETPAEIKMIESLGADVVGMTGYPEVVLARELTMCYASLCVVANPAAGIAGYRLTSKEVLQMMAQREAQIKSVLRTFIMLLPEERSCGCQNILEGAEV
ncbi:methylthioadenosine phosphorylase [Thermocrinis albus DSM 14484]|uniref:Probable 6-oxopurine nucleoside phosphorylase n=1 Tax=Thermocrinis albus (strain DSM 14484 / JCM 11386 / HI 11/12) TaxID=638303 RepID=D3SM87_THEAH|nr:S-methyl-5'-thioadenosine phosphorylase [Thermocrinis albus]ADC89867.1 methylthioadenosine phosphorylase [Thermocrinis albus DSM 14484]